MSGTRNLRKVRRLNLRARVEGKLDSLCIARGLIINFGEIARFDFENSDFNYKV